MLSDIVRGRIERDIDSALSRATSLVNYSRHFKPIISREEDMALGFVMGFLMRGFFLHTRNVLRREPEDEEIDEFFQLLDRRAQQIMSTIHGALT